MNKDLKDTFEEIELRKKSEKRILENLEKAYLEQKHLEESNVASIIGSVDLTATDSNPIELNSRAKEIEVKKLMENRRRASRFRYGAVAAAIVLMVAITPVINNILGRSGVARNQATSGMALDQSKSADNVKEVAGGMAPVATYNPNPSATEEIKLRPVLSGEIVNIEGKKILRVTLVNSDKITIDGEITVVETNPNYEKIDASSMANQKPIDSKKVNVTPDGTLFYDIEIGNTKEDKPRSWKIDLNFSSGEANENVTIEVQEGF
ncbi:MAG: hypothetical protein QMB63_07390 [Clostridiaceae bacterium]